MDQFFVAYFLVDRATALWVSIYMHFLHFQGCGSALSRHQSMTGKVWKEGVRAQALRRWMEGVIGFLRQIWWLVEGGRFVWDCVLWHVLSRNKIWLEFRVPVRVYSLLSFTGSCGNQTQKQILNSNEICVQWCRNSELIVVLSYDTQCSVMNKMPIIDDDVVKMRPSDLVRRDNRGQKGVILGQKYLREPVYD